MLEMIRFDVDVISWSGLRVESTCVVCSQVAVDQYVRRAPYALDRPLDIAPPWPLGPSLSKRPNENSKSQLSSCHSSLTLCISVVFKLELFFSFRTR